MAGPGGQVGHQAGRARIVLDCECAQGFGERPVVTSAEEGAACRDHGRGVAGPGSRPAGGEVDVSVPCDVEAVAAAAGQPGAAWAELACAGRAARGTGDRGERAEPHSGRERVVEAGVIAWIHWEGPVRSEG